MRTAIVFTVAAVLGATFLALWGFGYLTPRHAVNPQCTPAAVASFNAYWQNKVADANANDIDKVMSQGIAATEQRMKLCHQIGG